ncbi:MAG TPA: NAD(P)-dependent oxidoreductase [Candidatus Limnocylindrales bacterium]|jgi:3-hydroxyisobutyrate dehydrogenase/2-hydroxy-3-oxopropionate reductase|nr:NAD(P)-dependent oxidoreductase [Candidatus Limnocylindrales bacterium]
MADGGALTVGLVGTGRMGSSIARAIARAGFPLVLHNRTRESADALAAELGARVVDTPAAAAREAQVVVTMLADDEAVRAVFEGADGLLQGAGGGTIIVSSSTLTPDTLRALEAPVRDAGGFLLDAPVSGSTTTAASGQLTLMVGGDAEVLERARPVLSAYGKTIFHMGPIGAGAAMKLAVNTVIFGLSNAVAEGLVLAELAGVDRELAYEVLANSAVGAPYVQYKRDSFTNPEGTPVAMTLDLASKDMRLIRALAEEVGVRLPQADTNLAMFRDAAADGRGELDFSRVASDLRERRTVPGDARRKEAPS